MKTIYMTIFIILIFHSLSVGFSAEVLSEDLGTNLTPTCYQDVITPLLSNINQCPLTDDSFDEFDAIECACNLPASREQMNQVAEAQSRKVGDMMVEIFKQNKHQMIQKVAMIYGANNRADLVQNNMCSMDAMTEIIRQRSLLPESDNYHCSSVRVQQNSQKYFGKNFSGVIESLGEVPAEVTMENNLSRSLFTQPLASGNFNQCLSPNVGRLEFESLKVQNDDKQLTPEQVNEKIQELQAQCAFMMSSAVDLLCSVGTVAPVVDQGFLEKHFDHDPFNVDFNDDNYIALQNLWCQAQSQSDSEMADSNLNCLSSYTEVDVERLARPQLRTAQVNTLIQCHREILGNDSFLVPTHLKEAQRELARDRAELRACALLACSNIAEISASDIENVNCVPRNSENQLLTALNDIRQINCAIDESNASLVGVGGGNFCENGKLNEAALSMLNLLIMECRAVECMRDDDIRETFAVEIQEHPQIRAAIETPVEEMRERNAGAQRFWERFSGETAVMAATENFTEDLYFESLRGGFVGSGYSEPIPAVAEPIMPVNPNGSVAEVPVPEAVVADPNGGDDGVDPAVAAAEPVIEPTTEDAFTPSFSDGSESAALQALDREMHITRRLEDALADMTRNREILENAPLGSEARDRAFQELGRAQERVTGLERQFEELRDIERKNGIDSSGSFNNRFADTLQGLPSGMVDSGFRIGGRDRGRERNSGRDSASTRNRNRLSGAQISARNNDSSAIFQPPVREAVGPTEGKETGAVAGVISPSLPRPVGAEEAGANNGNDQKLLDISGGTGRGPAGAPVGETVGPARLTGTLRDIASNLSLASLDRAQLNPEQAYGAEIVVNPELNRIDLLNEILTYKQQHPNFQLGQVVTVKQLDQVTGIYKKARLIPLFNTNGEFDGYGISADASMRSQLVYKNYDRIKFRDLTRNEAYQLEMDIIVAQGTRRLFPDTKPISRN